MGENENEKLPLLAYKVEELQRSDERQWARLDDHHYWIESAKVRIAVIRAMVAILAVAVVAAVVWARGGWEALFVLLTK